LKEELEDRGLELGEHVGISNRELKEEEEMNRIEEEKMSISNRELKGNHPAAKYTFLRM